MPPTQYQCGTRRGAGHSTSTPGFRLALDLLIPSSYTRKHLDLPSPQATPMNACPGLRPRWCPGHIANSVPRTAAFRRMHSVGFPPLIHREIILLTTTKSISGLNTQPAPSIHPASYSHCWVCTWTSLLIRRLHFDQVGLELQPALTHWVTISNFIPPFGNPNNLGLTWHEHPLIYTLPELYSCMKYGGNSMW